MKLRGRKQIERDTGAVRWIYEPQCSKHARSRRPMNSGAKAVLTTLAAGVVVLAILILVLLVLAALLAYITVAYA